MQETITALVLLGIAMFAVFAGLGFLWGAGGGSFDKDGNKVSSGGNWNVGKVAFVIVFVALAALWLDVPGNDSRLAGIIDSFWGKLITGFITPIAAKLMEVALVFVVGYILFLVVRSWWRRR